MGLFAPIFRLFNKGAISNPDEGYQAGAIETTSTASGRSVTDAQALKISSVFACIQLISNAVAGLPITIFRETDDGREHLKDRHYLKDIFFHRPNAWMKPRDMRLALTAQMALFNNAYAEILRDATGRRIIGLAPLRPGRMAPFIDKDGDLTYHYHTQEGVKIYAAKSILHLKGFGFDGIVGVERNNYARESLGIAASADEFAAKQFANGGRPGGVMEIDKWLTTEQSEKIRKHYEGISEGSINSNKLWVLEGGTKYTALDLSADQLQMLQTRAFQIGDIARFFGVPDVLIGGGDGKGSAWPASFEQQMLLFLTHTIQPYLDEWEAAIRFSLLPYMSDIDIDHDASKLVKMDSGAMSEFLSSMTQNGLMDRNEARAKLNLAKRPGADKLTAQVNLTTLNNLETAKNDSQTKQPADSVQSQVRQ